MNVRYHSYRLRYPISSGGVQPTAEWIREVAPTTTQHSCIAGITSLGGSAPSVHGRPGRSVRTPLPSGTRLCSCLHLHGRDYSSPCPHLASQRRDVSRSGIHSWTVRTTLTEDYPRTSTTFISPSTVTCSSSPSSGIVVRIRRGSSETSSSRYVRKYARCSYEARWNSIPWS